MWTLRNVSHVTKHCYVGALVEKLVAPEESILRVVVADSSFGWSQKNAATQK